MTFDLMRCTNTNGLEQTLPNYYIELELNLFDGSGIDGYLFFSCKCYHNIPHIRHMHKHWLATYQ